MTMEETIILGNSNLKSENNSIAEPAALAIRAANKNKNLSIIYHSQNTPTIARTYLRQAQIYIEDRQWQQAIIACKNALSIAPNLAEAYKIWGNGLQKLNQNAEAIGCYAKALEIQPNMHEVYANLGTLYARKKAWSEAIEYFKECIALNPQYAGAYRSLAKIWEELGKTDRAWSCLFRALDLEPNLMTPQQYYEAANELLNKQETEKAIAFYRYAVQLDESFQDAYIKLGETLQQLGRHKEAVFYYRKIIEIKDQPQKVAKSSQNKFVSKFLAASPKVSSLANKNTHQLSDSSQSSLYPSSEKLSLQTKQTVDEAIRNNIVRAEQEPHSALIQINSGNLYFKNKQWDRAIACYHKAIQLNPKLTVAYRNLGNIYQALGKKKEAFDVYFCLGKIATEGENWTLAIECYHKAIELNPSHAQSHHNSGDALSKQQKWTEAALAYSRAIKIDPNFSWSYNNLGDICLKLQKWTEAVEFYQKAIEINSNFYWSHYNLGEALGKLFRWSEAIIAYQKTIELKPDFAEAYAHLGDALVREEKWEEGIKYYEKAIELNPGIDVAVYRNLKEALDRKKYFPQEFSRSNSKQWPYEPVERYRPPATLPDGSPWPKISIVTPSYNQGEFIEETILSVVHQNYPNVEYILIDGSSTDKTMQIVNQYREHFSYVVSEPDKGQSNAINKGFRLATGEIYAWLNSDDRLAPGALYAMALAFYTSEADVVAGICQIYKDGVEIEQHLTSHTNGEISLEDVLDLENCWLQGKFFYQPEVMFTRDIWERAGGEVNESLYYSMDYEMWARFAAKGAKLEVIGYPVAQYRMHEQQKTSAIEKYRPELLKVRAFLQQKYDITTARQSKLPTKERRNLKIVVLNDTGFLGGAGIANQRIAQALTLAGHSVFNVAGTLDWSLTPVSCSAEKVENIINSLTPDLLVIGNIHNFQYPLDILEKLSSQYPTIFVMHDQWLFTGRCGYTGGCKNYATLCDLECPTWEQYPRLAPSKIADAFRRKQALLQKSDRFLVLSDSKWLTNWSRYAYLKHATSESSLQFDSKFQHLYYGLDLDVFQPQDKNISRQQLGFPEDKFIILTGSQSLEDERKGFKYLLKALEIANLPDAIVLCFGHDFQLETRLNIKSIGYVENFSLLARYYSAADLFISPAIEEAFGQTFIEAAACGTPAVGYGVGGVKEAIGDRVSGRIVERKTPEALAQVIQELYRDRSQLELLSKLAPWYVANKFSLAASYYSIIDALNNSGWLSDLGMVAVSKLAVKNVPQNQYIAIEGNNPQSNLNNIYGGGVKELNNSCPREILIDRSLQGSGWHPAENVNGVTARWMEKLGTVFVEPINVDPSQTLLLELKVITAIELRLLHSVVIKINGNLIATKVRHQDNNWICWGEIPLNLLPQGVAFVITVEAAEAKQLSPLDLRKGSLLVERLLIKEKGK